MPDYSKYGRNSHKDEIVDFSEGQPVYKNSTGNTRKSQSTRKNDNRRYSPDGKPGGSNERGGYKKDGYSNRSDNERGGYKKDGYSNRSDNERGGYKKDGYSNRSDNERGGYKRDGYSSRSDTSERGGYKRDGYSSRSDTSERGGYKKNYERSDGAAPSFNRGKGRDARAEDALRVQPEAAPLAPATPQNDELPYIIMGRNAVREAVKSGRSIDRILVVPEQDGSLREVLSLARDANIQIRETPRSKLDELCMPFGHGDKPGNHQGILAQVPGVDYCELSDILDAAKAKAQPPFIILLDGIEDPHNLGSIIRSAECAGAHGVVIPKRRAAGVTAAACKASAGAVEYVKVARVSNLSGAMQRLKDEGMWLVGADMAGKPMGSTDLKGAIGLVIGGEGQGLSRLIKENCDFLVSIPLFGKIDSLNASVAAAVLMFEKKRQDG